MITSQQPQPATATPPRRQRRLLVFGFVLVLLILAALHWGGDLLIAEDPLPPHLDVGVVLQGSEEGQNVRLAGAMKLAQEGILSKVLVSIPPGGYWGISIPAVAPQYVKSRYPLLADRTEFCVTTPDVNSTEQEAAVLIKCIRQHGWHSVAVMTSNYHTRRAGILWRRVLHREGFSPQFVMVGVDDPEFHPAVWWHERLSAKTWFFEFTKLVWDFTTG